MPQPPRPQQVPELLHFHPEWWTDPLPPWLFTADLDRSILVQLASVQLEAQAAMLDQRAGFARRAAEIIQKAL
jgi:hypothetical protein